MRSPMQLRKILEQYAWRQMNVHVHTSLCDGKPEMQVEHIAAKAMEKGVSLIALVPHFHRRLSDETAALYHDTDFAIFERLREDIEAYRRKDGRVKFLLSSEVDILDTEGTLSMPYTKEAEQLLDYILPTLNFHPLLPLCAVQVTEPVGRRKINESGEYAQLVQAAGGMAKLTEAIYRAQEQAILKAPCTAMLGHFFSAHSKNGPYSWFGLEKEQGPLMKEGALKVIRACRQTGACIDITGIRVADEDLNAKKQHDGFLYDFQCWFLDQCRREDVCVCPGGDAHDLSRINGTWFYEAYYQRD